MPPALPRYIATYYETLRRFREQQAHTEGATRSAFQNLLDDAGRPLGLTVVAEQPVALPHRRSIRLDGEVRDQYRIRRGIWEAKDAADDFDAAIAQKIVAGYPLKNTLFENTRRAVLYQNGVRLLDLDITTPANLHQLLKQFLEYAEPLIEAFHQAVATFRSEIPVLAAGLREIIEREKQQNTAFRGALATFVTICRASLNPATSDAEVEDMLVQHLLTERIFRSVFENDAFVQRNVIAREIEVVITALTSRAFSRRAFLGRLDYFYQAIEQAARTISDYAEKQTFLNTVYEQFFQAYSTATADTHGIVYTPAPIVRWMVAAVEEVLGREFGMSLADQGVHILDPCVGTGTFLLELMEHIGPSNLPRKYASELHCNEVLLLPYYIATQNIEHEYYERTGQYAPFEGICFTDTLDLAEERQGSFFAETNTARVEAQKRAEIMVVIGNPPYNVGQKNENDNNKNRRYNAVDARIRETYVKASKATLKTQLYDAYVRFFRWAADRLNGRDGIVCFVSNNSFVDQLAFDGMRQHLLRDFTKVYHLDLHGNVRKNPKLSGTTHNVFGIQVGVGITIAVRRASHAAPTLHYFRVPELWTRTEKLDFLEQHPQLDQIAWQTLQPDARHTWITDGLSDDFATFLPMGSKAAKAQRGAGNTQTLFSTYTPGVSTQRDAIVYELDQETLATRIREFIDEYNAEVFRWVNAGRPQDIDGFVRYNRVKWSEHLKSELRRSRYTTFIPTKIREALYRPFCEKYLYYDKVLNDRPGAYLEIFPNPQTEADNLLLCLTDAGSEKPFMAMMTNGITDVHLVGAGSGTQCFPFYLYDEDGTNRRENITDWALAQFQAQYGPQVSKWDIFHSIYGILHAPDYRTTYAQNLKRDLPHIPFVGPEAWTAFVAAGQRLAALHVGYEAAAPYPLRHQENRAQPWTWRVERMRLTPDKTAVIVNNVLTLTGVPAAVFDYRLGNRSALEWIIDQYQVSTDTRSGIVSDPNNPDDPEAIVRLVKQIVTVSLETGQIVAALPPVTPLGRGA